MTIEAEQEYARGRQAHAAGDHGGALSGFLMALALAPDQRRYRVAALNILGRTAGYTNLPESVLDALTDCAKDPSLDVQPLAMVVRNLLAHHSRREMWLNTAIQAAPDQLEAALAGGTFDELLADSLVQSVLMRAVNISLHLEDILTALRRHAGLAAAEGRATCLLTSHSAFFDALCAQAKRTEFAWPVSNEEFAILNRLRDSSAGRRVLDAYEGTSEPALDFPDLTPVDDTVSKRVQSQYACYPYPRWEQLAPVESRTYASFMRMRFPHEAISDRFEN